MLPTFDFLDQLIYAARCQEHICKSLLEEYKLRASELDVLMFLALHPDVHTAKEICDDRLIAKSLVSTSVEMLVSRGFIARRTDPADRRRTLLTLLPEADAIVARAAAMTDTFAAQVCTGISPEDMRTFERVLAQMRHNMNEIVSSV